MTSRTTRHGAASGAFLAFLVSLAVLAGLIFLLFWKPKRETESGSLVVYCAAGLKAPVEELAREYEAEFGVPIRLTYGGSETLLSNIQVSGVGDLYIPADFSYIEQARKKDLLEEVLPVAHMAPVLAVQKGNPKQLHSLADLLTKDVTLTQANPDAAAIGKLTRVVLQKAGKWESLAKKTRAFKGTVTEVATDVRVGTVDAGIVWDVTVTQFGDHLEAVPLAELKQTNSSVTIGVLKHCKTPAAALRFCRYLAARDRGLKTFEKHGFRPIADGDLWADGEPKINLFAGAMLQPAIENTLKDFARREGIPADHIRCIYNGCGTLVGQMKTGQHPDAYFACDISFLKDVKDLFLDGETVSTNQLVLLVHQGNPKGIRSLGDLAKKGLKVGVGHEQQCAMGVLTQQTLTESKIKDPVMKNVVVQTPTGDMLVNQMLAAPSSLDAVIAYVSNARKAGDRLEAIAIDIPCAIAAQPVAVGKGSNHKHLMERLVRTLRSGESRQRFEDSGFKWNEPAR